MKQLILLFVVSVLCFIFLYLGHSTGKEEGYREGQIDALNGKIKYETIYTVDSKGDTLGVQYLWKD